MAESRVRAESSRGGAETAVRVVALAVLLYGFLVSIGLLGKAFKAFGGGVVDDLIASASAPLVGLFIGVLATTLVQSSSTTTSLVVALVGGGTMSVDTAIPVIMGANIGTSVTNTLVSLGHVTRSGEYSRAVAASTVHDFFNIFAVLILFPLQVSTNILGRAATALARGFQDIGGLTFTSPLKLLTEPAVKAIAGTMDSHPWWMLLISLALMFGTLRYLVVTLRSLVLGKVETLFDVVLFRSPARAMLFGLALTVLVQSSSITTSLVIPFAGAGLLSLHQIFPYTLGANVGTTVTAILAALATGQIAAVTVAFSHFLFNVLGIALIWPIRRVRNLAPDLARRFGTLARRQRWIPIVYILAVFYALPLALILLMR